MTKRLKDELELDYFMLRHYGQDATPKAIQKIKRRIRDNLRCQPAQETASLRDHTAADLFRRDAWRKFYRVDDWESWTEAIIIRDDGYDDEELNDVCKELEMHSNSPYDCTGKPCTAWIDWKRTPAGIVFIHCIQLDV